MDLKENKIDTLELQEELKRFEDLEKTIDSTITMIDGVIELFNNKVELARGSTMKLAALIEQKVSLLMRKESVIRNIADIKKVVFNTNTKIKSANEGDNNLQKAIEEFTNTLREQQKEINQKNKDIRDMIKNNEELEEYFRT